MRVSWKNLMLLLALGVFVLGLAAEAGAYAFSQQAGDLTLIVNALALLLCAFLVGDAAEKSGLLVAALCGVGVATIYWGMNREFVLWFRMEVVQEVHMDWRSFSAFYSMLNGPLSFAGAGAAALGAGAARFQARARNDQD